MEIFIFLMISIVLGIAAFFGIRTTGEFLVNNYIKTSGYMEREEQKSANSLQAFVTEYSVDASDYASLNYWVNLQEVVYITVLRDGIPLYDSAYPESERNDDFTQAYYGNAHLYDIQFADGEAEVYLIGFYDYHYSVYIIVVSIIFAVTVFILLFLLFVQRKINYVKQIEKEVKILENGGLQHEITVRGHDELSSLASGLNKMRVSLSENFEMVNKLSQANADLVTELSHDLRTPLTAMLLYMELLETGRYKDAVSEKQYIEKAAAKAREVKQMSDELFERFLITGNKAAQLEAPQNIRYVLEDTVSDIIIFLKSQGYEVSADITWPEGEISVSQDYLNRIFNNVNSNILKYAEPGRPILIRVRRHKKFLLLTFGNVRKKENPGTESTNIGIPNIRMMMQKMNGCSTVLATREIFMITLSFPVSFTNLKASLRDS